MNKMYVNGHLYFNILTLQQTMDERREDFYFNNTMPNLKGNQVFLGQDCKGKQSNPHWVGRKNAYLVTKLLWLSRGGVETKSSNW